MIIDRKLRVSNPLDSFIMSIFINYKSLDLGYILDCVISVCWRWGLWWMKGLNHKGCRNTTLGFSLHLEDMRYEIYKIKYLGCGNVNR